MMLTFSNFLDKYKRWFMSVTNSSRKRKTRSDSVIAKMIKSGDVISSHQSFDRCPIILWIIGMHIAHRIGSNQLRQIALFTPRFVEDKFDESFIVVFCCFLIEFDGEWLWSDASMAEWELSVEGVVVVVVLVFIEAFFNDDFLLSLWSFVVDMYIAEVSISNSDCIIKTIATSVDELSNNIAAKLELNSPIHSLNWQKRIKRVIVKRNFCAMKFCDVHDDISILRCVLDIFWNRYEWKIVSG